ncbi:MAG: metal ABC transporter permease [Betaproteobacteria bacterium]
MSAELGILWPALAAGLVVAATHVPLGMRVLERGIVFIDLAVAQFAALGVVAADALGFGGQPLAVQGAALGAALAGALVLERTERLWPEVQEAVIGVGFILAANAAILLLAANPHGAEHLKDLLTGQILWVTPGQVGAAALVSAAVLAAWFGLRPGRTGFYLVFAVAVTVSVQLVGIYLVFATLIVPALATRSMKNRLALAYALAAVAYVAGLALSLATDLPAGPLVTCAIVLPGLAAVPGWRRRR